jgi:hypothetical protein
MELADARKAAIIMDDVERHLAEQMADRLRTRIEEFESLKVTGPEPEWVGAKVALIRRLLADLENTMQ